MARTVKGLIQYILLTIKGLDLIGIHGGMADK